MDPSEVATGHVKKITRTTRAYAPCASGNKESDKNTTRLTTRPCTRDTRQRRVRPQELPSDRHGKLKKSKKTTSRPNSYNPAAQSRHKGAQTKPATSSHAEQRDTHAKQRHRATLSVPVLKGVVVVLLRVDNLCCGHRGRQRASPPTALHRVQRAPNGRNTSGERWWWVGEERRPRCHGWHVSTGGSTSAGGRG